MILESCYDAKGQFVVEKTGIRARYLRSFVIVCRGMLMEKNERPITHAIVKVIAGVVCTILAFIGLFLAVLGLVLMKSNAAFISIAKPVTGVVTEINASYIDKDNNRIVGTKVAYIIDGVTYNEITHIPQSTYEGQEVTLFYRPDKPQLARTEDNSTSLYRTLIGVGAGFILGSLVFGVAISLFFKKNKPQLEEHGRDTFAWTKGTDGLAHTQIHPYTAQKINTSSDVSKKKSDVVGLIACLFFLSIGFIMLISHIDFMSTSKSVVGIITNIEINGTGKDESYTVYVSYTINGIDYHGILGEYAPNMHSGKSIKLYYQPDSPERVRTGTVGLIIGVVFIVVGGASPAFKLIAFLQKTRNKRLVES